VNKNKYLYCLIGVALGFIVSFFWTQSINKTNAVPASAGAPAAMTQGGAGGGQNQQAMMATVAATLEKAKNNPKDFDAQIEAARTYAQIGKEEEAVEFLKKAYEINPKGVGELGAFGYLGQHYLGRKNYAEAETWFRRAIEVEPKEPDLYVELAATFTQREPAIPDRAIPELEQALKLQPKNGHALGHLIEAYALKKDARMAEETLGLLRGAEPTNQRISVYEKMIADLKAGRPVTIPKE
jgi:Flp pilus assembly protein TadD